MNWMEVELYSELRARERARLRARLQALGLDGPVSPMPPPAGAESRHPASGSRVRQTLRAGFWRWIELNQYAW